MLYANKTSSEILYSPKLLIVFFTLSLLRFAPRNVFLVTGDCELFQWEGGFFLIVFPRLSWCSATNVFGLTIYLACDPVAVCHPHYINNH